MIGYRRSSAWVSIERLDTGYIVSYAEAVPREKPAPTRPDFGHSEIAEAMAIAGSLVAGAQHAAQPVLVKAHRVFAADLDAVRRVLETAERLAGGLEDSEPGLDYCGH